MTSYRAEGRQGHKTAPTQKRDDLPVEEEDRQSYNSAKPTATSKAKRTNSPEKVFKQVTWVPGLKNSHGGDLQGRQLSAGLEPGQIKQYMNLKYNSKEAQTNKPQPKAMTNSKVSDKVRTSTTSSYDLLFFKPFRRRPR